VGDTLYMSVPFTWLLVKAEGLARAHRGPVVAGGPAVELSKPLDWAETPGECPYDVLAMHNPLATFTTRGCPNACPYCVVPRIEGGFRELAEWKAAPLVCDNNLLASTDSHFRRVVKSLRQFPACDFNQGLDAARFTRYHADEIATLKSPMVRFAFDAANDEAPVADALTTARAAGLRNFGVYVLIGYDDTPEEARYRLEQVREWGIRPNPMRYQPLDATEKNAYVAPGWTGGELRRMTRYYSRLRWLEHVPYEDYQAEMPLFKHVHEGGTATSAVPPAGEGA